VLGASKEEAQTLAERLNDEGRLAFSMSREAALLAMERLVAMGPDEPVTGSRGSLIASVEEVDGDAVSSVRCGRLLAARFVSMDRAAIEASLERSAEAPLFAVCGANEARDFGVAAAVVTPFVVSAMLALAHGTMPWFLDRSGGQPSLSSYLLVTLAPFAAAASWLVVRSRRWGRAVFYESAIFVNGRGVRWADLRGFRDDHDDHVVLLTERRRLFPLYVPTLTAEERAAVLELLVARGVPRESADGAG
jgi:hypothetical protein